MSKKDPKKAGKEILRKKMKEMMAEKFSKGAEEKGVKKLMKATIIAEDQEGLGEGAKTLAEMMLDKYKSDKDEDSSIA
jgi:hypothetical protein